MCAIVDSAEGWDVWRTSARESMATSMPTPTHPAVTRQSPLPKCGPAAHSMQRQEAADLYRKGNCGNTGSALGEEPHVGRRGGRARVDDGEDGCVPAVGEAHSLHAVHPLPQ